MYKLFTIWTTESRGHDIYANTDILITTQVILHVPLVCILYWYNVDNDVSGKDYISIFCGDHFLYNALYAPLCDGWIEK